MERGEAAGEKAEEAGDQAEVCDSVTHNLIFSSHGDNDDGREGGGVAEDAGGKEEKG